MKKAKGLTVEGKTVVLDNTEFIECHFINCQIRYSGGEVNLDHSTMKNCTWDFQDSALRTIALLRTFGIVKDDPSSWPVIPQHPLHGSDT